MIEIIKHSLLGKRENQQDYCDYYKGEEELAAVLCDGMGGLNGGEKASSFAVTTFLADLKEKNESDEIKAFLREEAYKLDEGVLSLTDEKGKWLKAGTTIIALVATDKEFHFMSVGDSKLIIQRGDEISQINRNHNYKLKLDTLLDEGSITKEAYDTERSRENALISYLGYGNISIMDVSTNPFRLYDKDKVMLCTDGVTQALSNDELLSLLKQDSIVEISNTLKKRIEEKALANQDNATWILMKYEDDKG